jgi:hypothetical protein
MPFPNSRVIPPGWQAHHRPVVEGTWTAWCTIDAPGVGPGIWNPVTMQNDPPARVVLHTNVPCRVQQHTLPQAADVGTQQVSSHDYLVVVPVTITDVAVDHCVTVTGSRDQLDPVDPSLIGRLLVITDVQRGSLLWERDLIAIDNLG